METFQGIDMHLDLGEILIHLVAEVKRSYAFMQFQGNISFIASTGRYSRSIQVLATLKAPNL